MSRCQFEDEAWVKKRNMKNYNDVKISILLFSVLVIGPAAATAEVLGEWNFDTGSTSAERRMASGLATGVSGISELTFNMIEDAGVDVVPASVHDGIGFGGSFGEQAVFIHRANYFDHSTVPPKEDADDFTSFGPGEGGTSAQGTAAGQGDGKAAVFFTVTAGAQPVQVASLTIDTTAGNAPLIISFQEAGSAAGTTVNVNEQMRSNTAYLPNPVLIAAGETKTFSVNLNSGTLDSRHVVNRMVLHGEVNPELPTIGIIAAMGTSFILTRRHLFGNKG